MKLSALTQADDFALLGPGFTDRQDAWVLLRRPRPVALDDGSARLVYAAYDDRAARAWAGEPETVALELDVPAPPLAVTLEEGQALAHLEQIRAAIAAGDVYQVNYTLRAALECESGAALLSALCRRGVPRFAAWVRLGDLELVSASPELLFEVHGRRIHAEPMKGTAAAGRRAWLEASEKDRAELAMITDLLRDDLNHLCERRSVAVEHAQRFVELPYAVQAVSDVAGTLRGEVTLADALAQLHPGGSVTGAPRPAARELISRLEPTPRGAYCGTLGWLSSPPLSPQRRGEGQGEGPSPRSSASSNAGPGEGPSPPSEAGEAGPSPPPSPRRCGERERLAGEGAARFALLIRTAQRLSGRRWVYGVGSGITWDSDAHAELEEIRLKLGALW